MKHRIEVRVKNKEKVLDGRVMKLPARLVHWLLGDGMKVLVITPGDTVVMLTFTRKQQERRPQSEEDFCLFAIPTDSKRPAVQEGTAGGKHTEGKDSLQDSCHDGSPAAGSASVFYPVLKG